MFDRVGPRLELLEARSQKDSAAWQKRLAESQFVVMPGQYVGQSTCNNFTSALGAGQRVLSYAYYRPYIVATRE